MSTFVVPLLQITTIQPHPNADRLELAIVAEAPVIVGKGQYQPGDTVIYVPVGSVLPNEIKEYLARNSKISLSNRVKATKIRGVISQGLILDPVEWGVQSHGGALTVHDAIDVSKMLGITKYEEPAQRIPGVPNAPKRKRPGNPTFKYYTDIENVNHYPDILIKGELVWITEKLHGTSFRCGWFKKQTYTFWEKVKRFFYFKVDEWEFLYGSRKVDITASRGYVGWYGEDIYGKVAEKYDLVTIPRGYAVYGEIVGPGVQKNYSYGYKEHTLFVYDVLDTSTGRWLDAAEGADAATSWGLEFVPILSRKFPYDAEKIREYFCDKQVSRLDPETTREGVVVKPLHERNSPSAGRVIFKFINPEYLLKDTTEFQ